MTTNVALRRRPFFLVLGLGALLGTSAIPVPILVTNETLEPVRARSDGSEWVQIPPGATREVVELRRGGLCSPSKKWLHDDFDNIELEFANGTTRVIGRDVFLREAEWSSSGNWKLRVHRAPR